MTWEICNQRDHYLHNYRFIVIAFSSFANSDCELIDLVITIIMNALMKQTSEDNCLSLHLYSSVQILTSHEEPDDDYDDCYPGPLKIITLSQACHCYCIAAIVSWHYANRR